MVVPTGFTTLSIANMALSSIGQGAIVSLAENSAAGNACSLWYDFCRLQTLAAYNWSFARKRATLTEADEDDDPPPEDVWLYRYVLPTDCVAVREVVNPLGPSADAVPYALEQSTDGLTKTLLTNLEDAQIVYTANVTLINMFTPFFIDCLAACIAYRIAYTITGSLDVRNEAGKYFVSILRTAPAQDGNETVEQAPRDSEAIRARA